jgi:uncharacterized protein (TIGR03083 family)
MTIDDRLDTLGTLWAVWADAGRAMTDDQWRLPTRLDGWDVRSLYAHHGGWPLTLSRLVDRVRDEPPTYATAADVLRRFNAPDGVAHTARGRIAARAREDAAAHPIDEMVGQFTDVGPRAIEAARRLGPVVVDLGGPVLRIEDAVSVGVIEATVHLLDLLRALGREPDVPAAGLAHTTAVLAAVADPVGFIEAATGRTETTPFPVLT